MVHVLVRVKIKDLATWKQGFEAAGMLRKQYGSLGAQAFAIADNPNEILILAEYVDAGRAKEMFASPEFREATQRAGLTAAPEVTYLNEVVKLPA